MKTPGKDPRKNAGLQGLGNAMAAPDGSQSGNSFPAPLLSPHLHPWARRSQGQTMRTQRGENGGHVGQALICAPPEASRCHPCGWREDLISTPVQCQRGTSGYVCLQQGTLSFLWVQPVLIPAVAEPGKLGRHFLMREQGEGSHGCFLDGTGKGGSGS